MQSAYNVGMKTAQYTIRSVPPQLDAFLRRQARISNRSLNQVVLDYVAQAARLDMRSQEDDFSWLIGANAIDAASLQAIRDLKAVDKKKQA
jgi:hypothetical protein